MKKTDSNNEEVRTEYDFRRGVRGKYARAFAKGSNVVVLDPDIATEFRTAKAVNDALRRLIKAAKRKHRGAA